MVEQERIAQIIDYINVHGEITNRETRELLGLADSTTKRFLRKMVAQSLLVVEGIRKTTRYRLASKNEYVGKESIWEQHIKKTINVIIIQFEKQY